MFGYGNFGYIGGGGTGGGGGGGGTYNGASPSNITVGGLPSGSVIAGQTFEQLFQSILVAYLPPSFNTLTSGVFGTYEVGQSLPSGLQSIGYSVNNSSNIKTQPPNVGVPSTNIPGATFPVNPFQLLASGAFDINIPASTTLTSTGNLSISLQGTNSQSATFSTINYAFFYFRRFVGENAATTINETQIEALSTSNALATTIAGSYSFSAGAGLYKYFTYPDSFGNLNTIKDQATNLDVSLASGGSYSNVQSNGLSYALVSVTNPFGVTTNYRVFRTLNTLAGALTIVVT